MSFHERLKEIREMEGVSQSELARRSGISQTGISDLEKGINKPTWETVQRLAKALNRTCQEFEEEIDMPPPKEEPKRGRPAKPLADPTPKRGRGRPRKE